MNKKKSIISVLLLFFFIFTLHLFVYANDIQVYDLERLLAETQSKASYLSNSNIIIRDFIGYNVFSDKSTQLIEHEAIQIITEEGLKKFRDLTYYYDRYNQVLDIKIARYITPEGKIFDLAKDKITRKQVFEESSAFTNIFAVKMNFSDAPVGSIVEYCVVTNEKKLPLGNNFWCISYTQDTNPNMDSTFRVNFPQSYNINWITTKQKIEPVI